MKIYLIMISTLVLTSCFEKSALSENQKSAGKDNTETIDQNLSNGTPKDSILIENRVKHAFSQVDSKDEFYICIKGKSILDGKMIFKITKSDGTVILNEEFPSYLLMNYSFVGDENSEKDKEEYIKSRIMNFLNESNFIHPAIKPDEVFDEDYSHKEIWEEIKSDQTLTGFSYLIGEEDGRKIAFSKKKGKAVIYFNCC